MKKYIVNPGLKDSLIMALLYLCCGVALCFFKGSILYTAVRVIGIALMAYGIWQLYIYFGLRRSVNSTPMIMGVPSVVFGLILAVWPGMIINIFPTVIGILLLFNSITQIQAALVMKSAGAPSWLMSMIFALAMLALAFFLIIRPSWLINTLTMVAGIALIAEAIIMTFDAFARR